MAETARPAVFTIPSNRAFADSLAAGLIKRFGGSPLGLAQGRILLPNNRAVRAVTDAFVRLSRGGLLLPRLIPIGDPDLGERIGGVLEPAGEDGPPPAIDSIERLFTLAGFVGRNGRGAAESLRLAGDLARALDALQIEQISPTRLKDAAQEAGDLARHWEKSLAELEAITRFWPALLDARGAIDLTERRNRLLDRLERRWSERPPAGFTIAAGISTAAPAVARLLARVARMTGGEVVLPGLWLSELLPDDEWRSLGPDEEGRSEPNHPQYHLKLLLDRMGVNRAEVAIWPSSAGANSPAQRSRAVANALAAPDYSHKWETLKPSERRMNGIRLAQFPDNAAEAQGIALAIREAIETPAQTVALVTPDRLLAARVSALLERWGIEADDSAGRPLSQTSAGSFILSIAAAAAEELAPVALLALLKHPLAGGVGDERLRWLDQVRRLDLALRGPRPAPGIVGLDRHFEADRARDWIALRPFVEPLAGWFDGPLPFGDLAQRIAAVAEALAGSRAWAGADGRLVADLVAQWQELGETAAVTICAEDAVPLLRQLLDAQSVRPPYGKHPRVFIWGVLEARLQSADVMILGGLNEGTWPAAPNPDPWLPPRVRAHLGMPTLESRIGLSAHDFASALGAPNVLITRSRRDSRSPTVASRFWLRLIAIDPQLELDRELPWLAIALDDPGKAVPVGRPAPIPRPQQRPTAISVTDVDRLKADPFAFYAKRILRLKVLEPLDIDPTAAWKGTAVHQVLQRWFEDDRLDPRALFERTRLMLGEDGVHPLVRALWQPRLTEAIDWVARRVAADTAAGRIQVAAECEGKATIAGIALNGTADRIDRMADGDLAIVDYKTGQAPKPGAIDHGFALQLGLLGLIAQAGGFGPIAGRPRAFEYWSLAKGKDGFGYCRDAAKNLGADGFMAMTEREFASAAGDWLTGTRPFVAKLNPAHAPYGDYDQLMRLEEWYGRE